MSRRKITALVVALATLGLRLFLAPPTPPVLPERAQTASVAASATSTGEYRVARVVDGDTVKIESGGSIDTVRLIGINTPETVDPRKSVECFGKEASARMKELAEGKTVLVKPDPTQDLRDKYGRLLAYLFLSDGTFLNERMVAEGYAYEYTYRVPYQYQTEFKAAERRAREAQLGLWNPAVCPQNTHALQ